MAALQLEQVSVKKSSLCKIHELILLETAFQHYLNMCIEKTLVIKYLSCSVEFFCHPLLIATIVHPVCERASGKLHPSANETADEGDLVFPAVVSAD